ncbi:MAG: flavodoxin family protein [Clostridia bacterium]|nr:flavodoxin family protein [Clostridia bacterium]
MKTLIVYYSLTGNVDFAARTLSERIGADLLRLEVQKDYPDKGIKKFLFGGKSAVMGEKPPLKPYSFAAGDYERIVFCSPIWAGTFAPPLRTFIGENASALSGKRFAALLCCSGGGSKKAFERLRGELGADHFDAFATLIDPKDKPEPVKDSILWQFADELTGE